jgi:hypothetical protein
MSAAALLKISLTILQNWFIWQICHFAGLSHRFDLVYQVRMVRFSRQDVHYIRDFSAVDTFRRLAPSAELCTAYWSVYLSDLSNSEYVLGSFHNSTKHQLAPGESLAPLRCGCIWIKTSVSFCCALFIAIICLLDLSKHRMMLLLPIYTGRDAKLFPNYKSAVLWECFRFA